MQAVGVVAIKRTLSGSSFQTGRRSGARVWQPFTPYRGECADRRMLVTRQGFSTFRRSTSSHTLTCEPARSQLVSQAGDASLPAIAAVPHLGIDRTGERFLDDVPGWGALCTLFRDDS